MKLLCKCMNCLYLCTEKKHWFCKLNEDKEVQEVIAS